MFFFFLKKKKKKRKTNNKKKKIIYYTTYISNTQRLTPISPASRPSPCSCASSSCLIAHVRSNETYMYYSILYILYSYTSETEAGLRKA